MIQGHTFIVLTLPLLFLTTVIFMMSPSFASKGLRNRIAGYFVDDPPTGGSSMIQGHTFIVFTLPLLFLITVIFMTQSLCAGAHPLSCVDWAACVLPQVVDDHIDEPGTERAVLLGVLSLLALHLTLR